MKKSVFLLALFAALPAFAQEAKKAKQADHSVDRGRYLIKIAGCNDCHTPGYGPMGGKVPETQWLVGDNLGFNGSWGTTYAANLRLYFSKLTEDQWVKAAKELKTRPLMPWFNLHDMTTSDLRAMYRFVRQLPGPMGNPAPAYLPPDQKPQAPYMQLHLPSK